MKYFVFSLVIASLITSQDSVSAQQRFQTSPSFTYDQRAFLKNSTLFGNCSSGSVSVQSQKLQSPTSNQVVYAINQVEKIPNQRGGSWCSSTYRTFKNELIIQQDGFIESINLTETNQTQDWLIIAEPISFSPEGRYLLIFWFVVENDATESIYSHSLYDLNRPMRQLDPLECPESPLGSNYVGFLSANEIMFECPGETNSIEVLNLTTGKLSKPLSPPLVQDPIIGYGSILSPLIETRSSP